MPWRNDDPAKRARDARIYRDPFYLANRRVVLRRAGGRCERCGRRTSRLEVDHITPLAVRVDHSLANLRALCAGPGSCHARKTAQDSKAARRPAGARDGGGDPDFTPHTRW